VGAAKAIVAGLVAGHTKENPGYWLHTGGTGILTWEDTDKNEYGNKSEHVCNDWDGVDELLNLPDHAFHRNVDQLVLEAAAKYGDVLKTALVCPPTIYGTHLQTSPYEIPLLKFQQAQDAGQCPNAAAKSTNWQS
jgi:hypothetical protein